MYHIMSFHNRHNLNVGDGVCMYMYMYAGESQLRQMPRTGSSRNCSRTEHILRQKRVRCHHRCVTSPTSAFIDFNTAYTVTYPKTNLDTGNMTISIACVKTAFSFDLSALLSLDTARVLVPAFRSETEVTK